MSKLANSFSNKILLSNLIKIRWVAIIGQLAAITLAYFYFHINIPILICLLVVFISTLVNIISLYFKRNTDYLSDNEAFLFLLFDTMQLATLLYFTGGIFNPFSLLLIAPLVISASYLRITFSVILSSLSVVIVTFISFFYIEIEWSANFEVPKLFTFGLILALIISIIFITIYVYIFAKSSRQISDALTETSTALANQKKLSEVGSLSAAAVHELSTPLNTIFLILDDIRNDEVLNKNSKIKTELNLLKSQAERCKEILLRLSKNPQNLKDDFLDKTTISNIIKINYEKFKKDNIDMILKTPVSLNEPNIKFTDELMYGIGNIIQNAVEYAKKTIKVNLLWDKEILKIYIIDDGKGFLKETLDKIGNPYISTKNKKGMGLGIFIAKNLIENIGGKIYFSNNINSKGSTVEINLKLNS